MLTRPSNAHGSWPPGDQDVTASQSEAGVLRVADRPHSDKTVMNGDVSVNISPASIKTPAKPTTLPLGKYMTDAPPIGAIVFFLYS